MSLAFTQPFRVAPVVMTAVSSPSGVDTVTGRPSRISKHGFQFFVQVREADRPEEVAETISYIAWEPSSGTIDGRAFEVSRSIQVKRDQFHTVAFSEVFTDTPIFLADIQATTGGDPLNLRWEYKDLGGMDVKIDEAPANDGAASMPTDVVGYIFIVK